ncbi:MAG: hypothetical protein RID91_22715 [Azospirillaceae bacterium]
MGSERSSNRRIRITPLAAAVAAGALLAGCTAFNPYVESSKPRPGYVTDEDGKFDRNEQGRVKEQPVTVGQVKAYTVFLQQAYMEAVESEAIARNSIAAGLVPVSAAVLWGAVADTHKDHILLPALLAGSAAVGGQILLDPVRRQIYLRGADALFCVIEDLNAASASGGVTEEFARALVDLRSARAEVMAALAAAGPRDTADITGLLDDVRAAELKAIGPLDAYFGYAEQALVQVERLRFAVNGEIASREPDLVSLANSLPSALGGVAGGIVKRSADTAEFNSLASALGTAMASTGDDVEEAAEVAESAQSPERKRFSEARDKLEEAARRLAGFNGLEITVPTRSAPDCRLDGGSVGPFEIEPSTVTLPAGAAATLSVALSGGRAPYGVMWVGDPPSDGTGRPTPEQRSASSASLTVRLPQDAMTAGASYRLSITDSTGDGELLTIMVNGN